MRAAAILAASLVAIGAYLFVASFLALSAGGIAVGSLAIALTGALGAMTVTPARGRA
jgi:hypothetical protein